MLLRNCLIIASAGYLLFFCLTAHAVPSYARQTNQECSVCHIGSFGPQLTPYGMKFKIGGYTETNNKDAPLIPLSGMALAGYTNTNSDITPSSGFSANNNVALTEASVFLAGKLYDNIGSFIQGTYDGVSRKFVLDIVDVRFAKETTLFEQDMTLGLSLNNNPTSQDPFNTLSTWRFPYTTSADIFAATPGSMPVINGALTGRVFGLSAYSYLDKGLYVEFGGYMPSSKNYQFVTGAISDLSDPGQGLTGYAPYWRLAYLKDMKKAMFSVGFFGMKGSLRTISTLEVPDKFMDWGFDANYQYLGTREHVFALGGSYTNENIRFGQTFFDGNAEKSSSTLQEVRINASYHFIKTYGATISFFDILGTADNKYYLNNLGYSNNRPDSNGIIYQIDWTPFGKEDSLAAPHLNLRLGAQFTAYNKFNGSSAGASNNNTAFVFAWTSF